MSQSRRSDPERNAATLLALMGIAAAGAGLLLLAALVIPQILGLVLVAGGFLVLCALHYVVWGWWLSKRPGDEDET